MGTVLASELSELRRSLCFDRRLREEHRRVSGSCITGQLASHSRQLEATGMTGEQAKARLNVAA